MLFYDVASSIRQALGMGQVQEVYFDAPATTTTADHMDAMRLIQSMQSATTVEEQMAVAAQARPPHSYGVL